MRSPGARRRIAGTLTAPAGQQVWWIGSDTARRVRANRFLPHVRGSDKEPFHGRQQSLTIGPETA